jgi:hypothetical protein
MRSGATSFPSVGEELWEWLMRHSSMKDSTMCAQISTYRVLAKNQLSVEFETNRTIELSIQSKACKISVRPIHTAPERQRSLGGSLFAIEFEADPQSDLLGIAREGLELIEDFLSALSVVSGTTFDASELIEVICLHSDQDPTCNFIQFLPLDLRHWHKPVSDAAIDSVKNLLAHWDGLERGNRLRRAARRYRTALGKSDDISAFQEAHIGLESLEPPLAEAVGLTPGTEEVPGKCEKCKNTYVRKKTTLVGVRAFVHDGTDLHSADGQRKSDWKLINDLRNKLVHGLADDNALSDMPHAALLASMHYLHDGICVCSHAGNLTSNKYSIARGAVPYLVCGTYTEKSRPMLNEWEGTLGVSPFSWVDHPSHGLVPELKMHNSGLSDLEVLFGRLTEPFASATTKNIEPVNTERS